MLSRRRFLTAALASAGGSAAATGLYTWRVEPHWVEIVYRDLPVRSLPAALQGRTLAFLSDLHVGPKVDDSYLISVLRRIGAVKPDFVVFGGDFITAFPPTNPFVKLRAVLR